MTGSRALISDNHRINDDSGTYQFYAKLAARNERAGSYSSAEALWLKDKRRDKTKRSREWANARAGICRMNMTKGKVAA